MNYLELLPETALSLGILISFLAVLILIGLINMDKGYEGVITFLFIAVLGVMIMHTLNTIPIRYTTSSVESITCPVDIPQSVDALKDTSTIVIGGEEIEIIKANIEYENVEGTDIKVVMDKVTYRMSKNLLYNKTTRDRINSTTKYILRKIKY